jgi:hypothetical protein
MDDASLTALLTDVAAGRVAPRDAAERLRLLPVQEVGGFATLDTHRDLRTGWPEVVLCSGKTDEQLLAILNALSHGERCVLATRMSQSSADHLAAAGLSGTYHATARCYVRRNGAAPDPIGQVVVACAGTSDLPVAEEAAVTCETMGSRVERVYDIGVAGIHRVLRHAETLRAANAVVVAAGMEGALPSVVGGLVSAPVLAVPTSVGYGASFGGLAALLGMLNSCAAGVAVVNIDNGFGAGYCAHMINSRVAAAERAS